MKHFHLTLSVILAAILFHFPANALTVKLGSLAPSGSPWDKGLRQIAAEWSSISNGKIVLKIYPGGIVGDEEDMIRKMRIGQLSAAAITGVGLCRIFSGILAVQLPLLIRSDEELFYVLDKMKPSFEKRLEAKGFKILVWSKVGWVHFFSKNPVVGPDDLKKQRMFIYAGDPDGVQAWKDAGFHPVPLAPTDIMSSLQSNMVEAFSATPLSAASYQWFGLAKNMCGMKWAPLIGGIVVTTRTWEKIPSSQRPELLEATRKIALKLQAEANKSDEQALTVMKQHGLVINPVPPDVEAQWEAGVQNAFTKLAGRSFDKASYEEVRQHLVIFRANNAR